MELEELVRIMRSKPYTASMGKGTLAKRYKVTPELVLKAKKLAFSHTGRLPVVAGDKEAIEFAKLPKILIFDVETAPMLAYIWKLWKTTISFDHVFNEWFMLCWSAKWLYSDEIISDTLTPKEALAQDDSRIVAHLWKLIDEADIVVAYNGKKADIPWMNTRFILNNMEVPSPYYVIDPYETAKRHFGFPSNKLDALAKYFGIEHKLETDFSLWEKCYLGDKQALDYMTKYNKVDVEILEKVYLKMRPWIKNHPNLSTIYENSLCPTCGSALYEELEDKHYITPVGKYQVYRCKDCGAVFRGRKNLLTVKPKGINCAR